MRPALLLAITLTALAQTPAPGTITGTATAKDGATFGLTFIQLKGAANSDPISVTTEPAGKFKATAPAGRYTLSVDVPGMAHYEQPVTIEASRTIDVQVRLEESPSLRTLGEDPATIAKVFILRAPPPEGPAPKTLDGHPDLSGVWLIGPTSTPGMKLKPAAAALQKQRADNHSKDAPGVRCLPSHPSVFLETGFFQLVQSPSVLTVIFEGDSPGYRLIYLDGRAHPRDFGPSWLGHSVGHWEGDTLVIDTVGFHDDGWMSFEGHPHSSSLHVVQRLHRTSLGALELEMLFEDPVTFVEPFTTKNTASLTPDEELQEFICTENNQDVAHLVGK